MRAFGPAVLMVCFSGWNFAAAAPVGSTITYQGVLEQDGIPANGQFDFFVEPFGQTTGGTPLAAALSLDEITVTRGVFSTALDFGEGFFAGQRVYLAISVRVGSSSGGYQALSPRQELTATPYALSALSLADGGGVPTGAVLAYDMAQLPDATWIWSDGKTIGNPASGATNRANVDTRDLYIGLWNSFGNAVLPIQDSEGVPTLRGANAQNDFDAGKRLPVPDRRGRVSVGKDNLGGTSANRLTSAGSGISGQTLGAAGGAESVALTIAQLPAHSHTGLTLPASEDDNPDPPLSASIIGNNLAGASTTYSTATTGATGSGQSHLNVQPSIVTNFIIKL